MALVSGVSDPMVKQILGINEALRMGGRYRYIFQVIQGSVGTFSALFCCL